MTIGMQVLVLRKRANLSQIDAARKCGMQPAVFSRVERGDVDPRLSTLDRIVGGLGAELVIRIIGQHETKV